MTLYVVFSRFRDFLLTIILRQKPKGVTRSRRRTLYCNCSRMRVTPLVRVMVIVNEKTTSSVLSVILINLWFYTWGNFLVSTLECSLMMLHAAWRCFMQFEDASCSLKMLHAPRRCFMQFEDASCSLKVLHAAWWCFMQFEDASCSLKMLHAAWWCFMQLEDASCSLKMLHAAWRCFMQLDDASCCLKMLHATWRCCPKKTSLWYKYFWAILGQN